MPKKRSVLIHGVEDPSMPNPNRSIDREWFIERIKECKLTQRTFAQQTGLHLTSVIRLLGGKRPLKIDEIPIVAEVLRVPMSEVLVRVGLDPNAARNIFVHAATTGGKLSPAESRVYRAAYQESADVASSTEIAVIGWVDGDLTVHSGKALGPSHVPSPAFFLHGPRDSERGLAGPIQALRMQTVGSPYSGLDGAIVYFYMTEGVVPQLAPETLCIVELEDGTRKLRVVHRGYEPGRFNLSDFSGVPKEREMRLRSLYPVAHILIGGAA